MMPKRTRASGNAPGLPVAVPSPVSVDRPMSADGTLRALELHDVVPAGHIAIPVLHDRWSPHLRPGEFAVLDVSDTEPQFGELYGLMISCSRLPAGAVLKIVQPYRSPLLSRDDGCVMYRFGAAWGSYADGPLRPEWWQRKCRGRVVGVLIPDLTEGAHA